MHWLLNEFGIMQLKCIVISIYILGKNTNMKYFVILVLMLQLNLKYATFEFNNGSWLLIAIISFFYEMRRMGTEHWRYMYFGISFFRKWLRHFFMGSWCRFERGFNSARRSVGFCSNYEWFTSFMLLLCPLCMMYRCYVRY